MIEEIRAQLEILAEESYRKFNEKIVPDVTGMLGVRLPKIRQIAKTAAKTDAPRILREYEDASRNGERLYYEEQMMYGLIIGYAGFSDEERREWLDCFRSYMDNWAVCDSCCATYKWMKKNPEFWWKYLETCIAEGSEYSIRFAVVCMLDHYIEDKYVQRVLDWCSQISHDGYYAKMAVAWAVSLCYIKYPEVTEEFLKENQMDAFTQNKAIQKICDSYRVIKEEKQAVRAYKR